MAKFAKGDKVVRSWDGAEGIVRDAEEIVWGLGQYYYVVQFQNGDRDNVPEDQLSYA